MRLARVWEGVPDGRTDGPTDKPTYRDAKTHLKGRSDTQNDKFFFHGLTCVFCEDANFWVCANSRRDSVRRFPLLPTAFLPRYATPTSSDSTTCSPASCLISRWSLVLTKHSDSVTNHSDSVRVGTRKKPSPKKPGLYSWALLGFFKWDLKKPTLLQKS